MQTFLNIRNGWADGNINSVYEKMWIDNTIVAAPSDTALLEKLDEGLYLFFYGVEGAGAGNDTTTDSALSTVPFVVHVDPATLQTVVSNLNTLGIIDDTQKDAILVDNKVGVVTIASLSNPGEGAVDGDKNISLLAREQLEIIANLAAGTAGSIEAQKYTDILAKQVTVTLSNGREINVLASAFVK
jgi:hypothetical protein